MKKVFAKEWAMSVLGKQSTGHKRVASRDFDWLYEKWASSTEDNTDGDDEDYCEEEKAAKKRKLVI